MDMASVSTSDLSGGEHSNGLEVAVESNISD